MAHRAGQKYSEHPVVNSSLPKHYRLNNIPLTKIFIYLQNRLVCFNCISISLTYEKENDPGHYTGHSSSIIL